MFLCASVHELLICRAAAVYVVGGAEEQGVRIEGAPPGAVAR